MAEYKNIPVDPETYDLVKLLAKRNLRGLGAQVRFMANAEIQKTEQEDKQVDLVGAGALLSDSPEK